MSTLFGVSVKGKIIEVAYRGNSEGIIFTNPLAKLLADGTPVIPLDNSAQGIYTIGDIKNAIIKQDEK